MREEIIEWLTSEGHEAFGAPDGLTGVYEALRLKQDLVICDVVKPNLYGVEVFVKLHAHSEMADIPHF